MDKVIDTTRNGKPVPVAFRGVTNASNDDVRANLVATFERGYSQEFSGLHDSVKGGVVSIVGSGPSLRWTYKDVVGDVFACNSAHDFLIEHGIVPKWAMFWDVNPIIAKFITKPHKDVRYLVASRCHPSVHEALKGYDVTIWHAAGDVIVEELLQKYRRISASTGNIEPMVGGGSAGVTRALYLAGYLGYEKIHLFGADSSYAEGETHVTGSLVDQQRLSLRICGKMFTLAPWMALQVGDFKLLVPQMQQAGVKFTVHGTGLIPHVATFLDCDTPDIKIGRFERVTRRVQSALSVFFEVRNAPQLLGGSNAGI